MIRQQLLTNLKKVVEELGFTSDDTMLYIPQNPTFGDYATNIALQLAKLKSGKDKQNSIEIANKIIEKLKSLDFARDNLSEIKIAGGGFINFFIKDKVLLENLDRVEIFKTKHQQKILVEYGHANILKEVHIGHLRTFILGESLARIFKSVGHEVFRANYQGDIGLHVAKAVWGMKKLGLPSKQLSVEEKADYLGQAYALGNTDYDADPSFKQQIDQISADLYQKDSDYWSLYQLGRKWSLEYFEQVYNLLGIEYDHCFFESEVYEQGKELVEANIGSPRGEAGKIFEKSDGAVIFPGEKYARLPDGQGLHNRVFLNSDGNPTYEAKDLGLAEAEYKAFPYDRSIHVVGSEQTGYFQVIFKAIEMVFPKLKGKKYHLSYGMVGLKEGKMSSRTGEVVTVHDLLQVVIEKVREVMKESKLEVDQEVAKQIALGAIKFAYLKFAPVSNMVFDLEKSVSLQGDSGPYIQYAYARTQSVLSKADFKPGKISQIELEKEERALLTRLEYFDLALQQAEIEYKPNLICEYLLSLAKDFNLFYQKHRIIESDKKNFRLMLTKTVGETIKEGLELLGIEAPERM